MNFTSDVVIGLEIHIQLATASKLFSSAPTSGDQAPNTRCDLVDVGFPGSKPTLNKKALEHAIKFALALNCTLAKQLIFSRKSYFYPDLAKNYQITQYEHPIGDGGKITLMDGKEINLTRVHLEEDPASLIHPSGMQSSSYVLVDYNRSGNPLIELVTKPEIESPSQAREFLKQLTSILKYLKVYDGGILKADANVSIKEKNYTRVEIKNITGFKEVERALLYEIQRQQKEEVVPETRAWNAQSGTTHSLRKKESEEEYGYIMDPDLPVFEIPNEMIIQAKSSIPELPREKALRFMQEYKLKEEDAAILAQEPSLANLFEKAIQNTSPALAVTWIRHEVNRVLNFNKKTLEQVSLDEEQMLTLLDLIKNNEITENTAKKILNNLILTPFDVKKYVEENKLKTLSNTSELEEFAKTAIKENPKAVEDYLSGNEKSVNFLVGQVMRKTKGAASPDVILKVMRTLLQK